MDIVESDDIKESCDHSQDIIAFKIFDQCKIQDCKSLGPVISKEKCECVIQCACDSADLGRIILPDHPIMAPCCTACVKILKNSFFLTHIEIANIAPSPLKKGYWCADIIYYFEFTLQLFGMDMKPLKIICCPTTYDEMKCMPKEKDWIRAGTFLNSQVMLYGGEKPTSKIYSDIFCGTQQLNDPHFLIQVHAYPIDETLKDPCCIDDCNCDKTCCESICCKPICCDSYCEPFFYIFVTAGLVGDIKLVRMICREIQAKPCTEPPCCDRCSEDPRKYFNEMKFPNELFHSSK